MEVESKKMKESRPDKSGFGYAQQSQFLAPTRRSIIAQCEALGLNAMRISLPHVRDFEQSDANVWGKKENVENLEHLMMNKK